MSAWLITFSNGLKKNIHSNSIEGATHQAEQLKTEWAYLLTENDTYEIKRLS